MAQSDCDAAFKTWLAANPAARDTDAVREAFRAGWAKSREPKPVPLCWRNPPPLDHPARNLFPQS